MFLKETNIGRLILNAINQDGPSVIVKTAYDQSEAKNISFGLQKVASLPYSPDVYTSVQEMMKLASKCLQESVNEIERLQARSAHLEKVAKVRSVIDEMFELGLIEADDVEQKIAELMKKDERGIEIVKTAMGLVKSRPNGNVFFEFDKNASESEQRAEKRGMFDEVVLVG